MRSPQRSEQQCRNWVEMLRTWLTWLTPLATITFSRLMRLEPWMLRQYRQSFELYWALGTWHILRPLLLMPVGAAIAVWALSAFDCPPRLSARAARLLMWGPLLLVLLFSLQGYLYWNTEVLSAPLLQLVVWAGPLNSWLVNSGSWIYLLLGGLAMTGWLLRSIDRLAAAPRRDTLIEGGGDPWIQPPYHRRSIGVDPDSKWDLG